MENNLIIKEFEDYVYSKGILDIGYTQIPKEYTNSNMYENTIVLTVKMRDELILAKPHVKLKTYYKQLYITLTNLMNQLCEFIEKKGYKTYIIDQLNENINFSRVAQEANMGFIGKSNLLISNNVGSATKILLITTNMPISLKNVDNNIKKAAKFCNKCYTCVNLCPENALSIKNEEIIFSRKKCIGYKKGCTNCIENCPFYKDSNLIKELNIYNNLKK